MVKPTLRMILLACALVAVTVVCAVAQDKPDAANKGAAAAPATKPAAGGVVVFKDPVTGTIRQPDAAEIGQLQQQAAAAKTSMVTGATVQQIQGAGRGVGMMLPEDSMVSIVATKGADGKVTTQCVGGGQTAAAAKVAAGAQASKTPQTKEAPDVK